MAATKYRGTNKVKSFLKTSDVAKIFGVNPSTVCLWVKKGKLKPLRTLGGDYRFRVSDIEIITEQQESA